MSTASILNPEVAASTAVRRTHSRHGPVIVAVGREDIPHLLSTAQAIAARIDAEVRVVSVVPPIFVPDVSGAPVYLPSVDVEKELRDSVAELVQREIRQVADDPDAVSWEVALGDVASVLTSRANTLGASMLVMGIGQHRPIDRLLAAETTLRVVRSASAPVLAIGDAFDGRPRHVVVATDFSARSALAAQAVLPLLADGATLHLVHVWQRSGLTKDSILAMEERYVAGIPGHFARLRAALAIPPGVSVTTNVIEGSVAERLLDFADSASADLIVAGRQGLSFLMRFFVGSVTTALVRSARCAVLVVPDASSTALDRMQRRLTGTSHSEEPARWHELLASFTHRNVGRRADLEVDDPDLGAQTQERGYAFLGATYDPHDERAELMLGGSHAGASHLSRGVTSVDSIAVLSDANGADLGLCLRHGRGQTLLLFGPGT